MGEGVFCAQHLMHSFGQQRVGATDVPYVPFVNVRAVLADAEHHI